VVNEGELNGKDYYVPCGDRDNGKWVTYVVNTDDKKLKKGDRVHRWYDYDKQSFIPKGDKNEDPKRVL